MLEPPTLRRMRAALYAIRNPLPNLSLGDENKAVNPAVQITASSYPSAFYSDRIAIPLMFKPSVQ